MANSGIPNTAFGAPRCASGPLSRHFPTRQVGSPLPSRPRHQTPQSATNRPVAKPGHEFHPRPQKPPVPTHPTEPARPAPPPGPALPASPLLSEAAASNARWGELVLRGAPALPVAGPQSWGRRAWPCPRRTLRLPLPHAKQVRPIEPSHSAPEPARPAQPPESAPPTQPSLPEAAAPNCSMGRTCFARGPCTSRGRTAKLGPKSMALSAHNATTAATLRKTSPPHRAAAPSPPSQPTQPSPRVSPASPTHRADPPSPTTAPGSRWCQLLDEVDLFCVGGRQS
ncbi:hypothetical protein JOD54_006242 [Actinokineospora baliensis]|nr:hypothetical protein [Actinokineospora baliensis]